jgi:hypothetical protein
MRDAMPVPTAPTVVLTDDERETLERWARRPTSAQALALQCRIVLACADGGANTAIAERLGVTRSTVAKWRSLSEAHQTARSRAGDAGLQARTIGEIGDPTDAILDAAATHTLMRSSSAPPPRAGGDA